MCVYVYVWVSDWVYCVFLLSCITVYLSFFSLALICCMLTVSFCRVTFPLVMVVVWCQHCGSSMTSLLSLSSTSERDNPSIPLSPRYVSLSLVKSFSILAPFCKPTNLYLLSNGASESLYVLIFLIKMVVFRLVPSLEEPSQWQALLTL